jgi:hypothetical protein
MGDLNRLIQSGVAAATGTAREVVARATRTPTAGAIHVENGRIYVSDSGLRSR